MSYRDRESHKSSERRERSPRRITQDELNELTARVLRNRMRGSSDVERLDKRLAEYRQRFDRQTKRSEPVHREPLNEDDMTVEQLLRHERTSADDSARSIIKDKKYSNDLEYQDEHSSRLSEYVRRGDIDLKNTSQAKRLAAAMDKCQLCIENEHCCPMVSMGESVYLTLAPEPELAPHSTLITPIRHLKNTLQCDEAEWEEIRQYMIALSKFYYSKLNCAVVFYENAVSKLTHAAIACVPIPISLASAIQGYFKVGIMEQCDDFEQNHQPIIDTMGSTGPDGFKHKIAKEAPYFHTWFTLNGGMGHIVENGWPHGDLFARQVLGGALKIDPYLIKKQGRWESDDTRVDVFTKLFTPFDWTL